MGDRGSPGDEAVGPNQQAASVGHLADPDPLPVQIIELLAQPDSSGLDRHAQLGRDGRGGPDPTVAAETHDECEPGIVAKVERRDLHSIALESHAGDMRSGNRVGLKVHFPVSLIFGERLGRCDRSAAVALSRLDAV